MRVGVCAVLVPLVPERCLAVPAHWLRGRANAAKLSQSLYSATTYRMHARVQRHAAAFPLRREVKVVLR